MKEQYMKIALKEAQKAFKKGEIPIGCVIVKNNKIIAMAHNLKERKKSVLKHAELIAITKASKKLKNWRLLDCEMYITMQPCSMCASAIKQARIKKIYYGISNKHHKYSDCILCEKDINNSVEIESKILEHECSNIIKKFFENRRKQ